MADVGLNIALGVSGVGMVLNAVRSIGSAFGSGGLAGGLAAVGVAAAATAVALGVASVNAAQQFQEAMLSDVAHAGLAKSQLDSVSQSILQMSTAVGRSPTKLAQALYPILSSFSDIQNQSAKSSLALQTLKLSFETVAGTTTSGVDVANTAVSVFHALGLTTNNAAVNAQRMSALFDLMDKSVQDGNMSWQAYQGTIGKVALSIQGTKISFTEANAALDVLTASGFPSARQAGVSLSNLMTEMVIKQTTVATNAQKLGLAFNGQAFNSMNLAQRIAYLNQVTGGNQAEILKLLSGSTAAQKAFNALSSNTQKYAANLKDLQHAHGALASSFATASQGFGFAMQRLGAGFQALLITLGTALLPALTHLANAVVPIIAKFTAWLTSGNHLQNALHIVGTVLQGVAGFIGRVVSAGVGIVTFFQHCQIAALALLIPLGAIGAVLVSMAVSAIASAIAAIPGLIAGFLAWTISAGAAAVATLAATWPLLAIGAAIGVVIAIIILLVTHWNQVVSFLRGVWQGFTSWFMGALHAIGSFFRNIWNAISSFFREHIALIISIATGPFGALVVFIVTHWNQIKQFFSQLWQDVVGIFKAAVSWVQNGIVALWNGIVSIIMTWPGKMLAWGRDLIQNFINGITSMIGKLGSALGNIGNTVKSFLHFSHPDTGPLADFESWPKDMMSTFAKGIQAGSPTLQMALNASLKPLAVSPVGITPSGISGSVAGGQVTHNHYFQPAITISTLPTTNSTQIRQMVDMFEQELGRRFRGQTPGYASGGIF